MFLLVYEKNSLSMQFNKKKAKLSIPESRTRRPTTTRSIKIRIRSTFDVQPTAPLRHVRVSTTSAKLFSAGAYLIFLSVFLPARSDFQLFCHNFLQGHPFSKIKVVMRSSRPALSNDV